jgi:hypothetical protein
MSLDNPIFKFNHFVYVPVYRSLNPNIRIPVVLWKNLTKTPEEYMFKDKNISIKCGKISDLIIIDVDNKETKMKKWKELIKKHGVQKTLICETVSGGYHYYYKYNGLASVMNLGEYDIDVLSDGHLVAAPPSIRKGKEYKYINNNEIAEMPEWLVEFIISHSPVVKTNKTNKTNKKPLIKKTNSDNKTNPEENMCTTSKLIYPIDDDTFKYILSKLIKYRDNQLSWVKVLAASKNSEKEELFDKWSSISKNYDKEGNKKQWDNNKYHLNINFYIITEKIDCDTVYGLRKYIGIENKYVFDYLVIDKKKLETKDFDLKKYKYFIILSDTGTGKTTVIAKICKILLNGPKKSLNNKLNVISIVSRIVLCAQHVKSFKEQGIKLKKYNTDDFTMGDDIVIQIDSIGKITFDVSNYIVFIDEINSLMNYLASSTTLSNKRIDVFCNFLDILSTCKYFFCSDANISDMVINFVKTIKQNREDKKGVKEDVEDVILIENTFKNYKKIKAYHCLNETIMMDEIDKCLANNEPFTCSFDSKKKTKAVHHYFFKKYPKLKDIILLYTADTNCNFEDLSKQWIGKAVFYSPKIIFGLDFCPEVSQKVFLFSTKNILNPLQLAQQMTRNRTIKVVYYYISDNPKPLKFVTLDDVKNYYKDNVQRHSDLLKEFGAISMNRNSCVLNENYFLELFYYNEYYDSTFKANMNYHFNEILVGKGFDVIKIGVPCKMDKDLVKEMNKNLKNIDEKVIKSILNETCNKNDELYLRMKKLCTTVLHIKLLKAKEFKDIIFDSNKLKQHFAFCELIKNEKYLLDKQSKHENNEYTVMLSKNSLMKILLCRKYESILGVETLCVDTKIDNDEKVKYIKNEEKDDTIVKINRAKKDEIDIDYHKYIFNSKKTRLITTKFQLLQLLIASYKTLCGGSIIKTERSQKRLEKRKLWVYKSKLVMNIFIKHMNLLICRLYKLQDVLPHVINIYKNNSKYDPLDVDIYNLNDDCDDLDKKNKTDYNNDNKTMDLHSSDSEENRTMSSSEEENIEELPEESSSEEENIEELSEESSSEEENIEELPEESSSEEENIEELSEESSSEEENIEELSEESSSEETSEENSNEKSSEESSEE